jgi:hypothetical protein
MDRNRQDSTALMFANLAEPAVRVEGSIPAASTNIATGYSDGFVAVSKRCPSAAIHGRRCFARCRSSHNFTALLAASLSPSVFASATCRKRTLYGSVAGSKGMDSVSAWQGERLRGSER